MKATEQLIAEHEAVRLVLRIFQVINNQLKNKQEINKKHLERLLQFLKIFVDKCHHAKEEELLFPLLRNKEPDRIKGPVRVMLVEHEQGRELIRKLSQEINNYYQGDNSAGLKVSTALEEYISLLSQHIHKENDILFPMADTILSDSDQKTLFEEFENLETNRIGVGTHEGFHEMLEEYETVYLN